MSEAITQHSVTSLTQFQDRCPYAPVLYRRAKAEKITVMQKAPAEIGIACHAMLHAAGAAKEPGEKWSGLLAAGVAQCQTCRAENVLEGKRIAEEFTMRWEFPTGFQFEHGLAFDKNWKPVPWDSPNRRLRLILDTYGAGTYNLGEYEATLAVAQDYKSGWHVTEDQLETVQADAILTALWQLNKDEAEGVRFQIIGVRFCTVFTKDLLFDSDEDMAELETRKKRLEFLMTACENSGGKPNLNMGCYGCDYALACEAFLAAAKADAESVLPLQGQPADVARMWARSKRLMAEAEARLREQCKSTGLLALDGGTIGYNPTTEAELNDPKACVEMFCRAKKEGTDSSEMSALALMEQPGLTQLDNVAKNLYKELGYKTKTAAVQGERARYTATKPTVKFGFKKVEAEA